MVKRIINGQTERYVELLSDAFIDQDVVDSVCLDCVLSYDGTPVNTVTGFDHLEGGTVFALAGGQAIMA